MQTETYSKAAPVCPYCKHQQDHDGGFFYDEDKTEAECERCDRTFDMQVYTSTSWTCTARNLEQGEGR